MSMYKINWLIFPEIIISIVYTKSESKINDQWINCRKQKLQWFLIEYLRVVQDKSKNYLKLGVLLGKNKYKMKIKDYFGQ